MPRPPHLPPIPTTIPLPFPLPLPLARPPATPPRLPNDPILPPSRDDSAYPGTRHQRGVAPSIDAPLVEVKVEVAQLLALELLFDALPNFLGALIVLEEEGEFFEGAAVGFGEHEVLWGEC